MESALVKCEYQSDVLSELLDFPESEEPLWILGESYDVKTEKSALLCDVRSRLWFTYRRKFSPIGGTGPSSDTGWGCMLRCGQMILAQALICSHLGRSWRWTSEKSRPAEYQRILHCFLDRKDSCYSIHQMAQMGVGEGKSVGEWYGPNTVAQVLRKLTLFDDWSSLAVYVSMDHTVVIEDIKKQCHQEVRSTLCICGGVDVPPSGDCSYPEQLQARCPVSQQNSPRSLFWRPLLLLIPLRMGINNINPIYIQPLKECFKMPQSCGVLGGKPNLAYYFIGFSNDELIYLDPHTTQSAVDSETELGVDDQSYHPQRSPHRMKISSLDPSVALGFFCRTEEDFDGWCRQVQQVKLCLLLDLSFVAVCVLMFFAGFEGNPEEEKRAHVRVGGETSVSLATIRSSDSTRGADHRSRVHRVHRQTVRVGGRVRDPERLKLQTTEKPKIS